MALAEVIRFMKLCNELTDKEFYGSFCKSIGRELIVSSLYAHFKNNLDAAGMATNIQSKIMNKRKKIPNEASSYKCIDLLPSQVISECGSFLNFKDYFRFGHCNRSIYYSLYSPSKIQKISTFDILKCDNLIAFKNVKDLEIDFEDFDKFTPPNKAIWSNDASLEKLTIWTSSESPASLESIALINHQNVKELAVYQSVSSELLFKILSRFDGIERLKMGDEFFIYHEEQQTDDEWLKAFRSLPQLKHLDVDIDHGYSNEFDSDACHLMVATLSDQLESLAFNQELQKPPLAFSKLRKLDAWWNYEDSSPYDNVNTLQEITFHFGDGFKPAAFRLIANQKALERLVLSVPVDTRHDYSTSSGILKGIETALIKYAIGNEMNQRLSIEIHLKCTRYRQLPAAADTNKEFGLCVFRVVNALSTFKTKGWEILIRYPLRFVKDKNIETLKLKLLDSFKKKYSVQYKKVVIWHFRPPSCVQIIIESR